MYLFFFLRNFGTIKKKRQFGTLFILWIPMIILSQLPFLTGSGKEQVLNLTSPF